ncbi:MAG TPA: sugar ABC transporter permease [Egibacteraceae bacterium]|nr:sugar ABC transporter permease [Egibacteraceae bacterium]
MTQSTATVAGADSAPATTNSPAARKRSKRRAAWRRRGLVLLLMSPWIIGSCVFLWFPLIMNAYLSFTRYNLLTSPQWIGLSNYEYMLTTDKMIFPSVINTLWFIAVSVPLRVVFAFGVAVMLARAKHGAGFFRTVFYLPALAPPVAATLAFVYLMNPSTGPVNIILGKLGIQGPLWFNSPSWSKPALVLLAIWGMGNIMIIFLAAVLDVPTHLYESAELDGAGPFQRMRFVTIPTISPVILFAVVIGVIEGLQYFTQGFVAGAIAAGQASQAGTIANLEPGYPLGSTLFYPILLYFNAFRYFNMGYAAAMAMVLLVAAFSFTLLIVRNSRRWVHTAGRP